jgi:hypothetical protein
MVRRALRPSIPRDAISSMTLGLATCGSSRVEPRTRSRVLGPDGCEFLLVFYDGDFDEDNTFLLHDWFKHVPAEVLGKNFGVPRFWTIPPMKTNATFSRLRCRDRSILPPPARRWRPRPCRFASTRITVGARPSDCTISRAHHHF